MNRFKWLSLLCAVYLLCIAAPRASAQLENFAQEGEPPQAGIELLQSDPHDIIRFTEKAGGGWAKVVPVNIPNRKMPTDPKGDLPVEVLGLPGQKFSVKWPEVQSIDFWEQRLERETTERIKAGDFVGAYPYLAILIRDYPNRANLKTLRSEFLLNDAARRYKANELEPTLAMLEELRRYAPEYKPQVVLTVISRVTNSLMETMYSAGKLDEAQKLLSRLKKDYPNNEVESVKVWDEKFLAMAKEKREAAIAAKDQQNWRDARKLALESLYLYPKIPGGRELVSEIDVAYPLVRVGVMQMASDLDPTRIDNWAARRSGRLVYRSLFEMRGTGPEGGEYDFVLGDYELSPDRLQVNMELKQQKMRPPLDRITSQTLADLMAQRSQPGSESYSSAWAAAINTIGLDGPQSLTCILRRPNVLPASLLQIRLDGAMLGMSPGAPTGVYNRSLVEANEVRFKLTGEPVNPTQPREIVELKMATAKDAVQNLLKGEIDVIDHLFPADAQRLSEMKGVTVVNFPLPSVHMLVPCSDHKFIADRSFRRALQYAINREDILNGELLQNRTIPGCRVVSGPFPAGLDVSDPLGYAYDEKIEARTYQPQVATLLTVLCKKQMEKIAEKQKEKPPEMLPIRLAVPDDDLSQIACEAIKTQWEAIGLKVETVAMATGKTWPEDGTADLVYVAAAVWEPITDARRVLGPDGLAKSKDQLIGLGLRQLESANNWRDVRDRLHELHAIASNELPVIPLWQLIDSFAYREQLNGIGTNIVSLYQNVERWQLRF